jgi:hypothetical protein
MHSAADAPMALANRVASENKICSCKGYRRYSCPNPKHPDLIYIYRPVKARTLDILVAVKHRSGSDLSKLFFRFCFRFLTL